MCVRERAGELKVKDVMRTRENSEAKRENAFSRIRVSTGEQSAPSEKVIKRTTATIKRFLAELSETN